MVADTEIGQALQRPMPRAGDWAAQATSAWPQLQRLLLSGAVQARQCTLQLRWPPGPRLLNRPCGTAAISLRGSQLLNAWRTRHPREPAGNQAAAATGAAAASAAAACAPSCHARTWKYTADPPCRQALQLPRAAPCPETGSPPSGWAAAATGAAAAAAAPAARAPSYHASP